MPVNGVRRVGVIGAGMVGVCTASWLQRDGHSVFLVEMGQPGHGASFGNAGCFNGSSVTPVSMPGVIRNLPRWLSDPLGPLSLRWSYLPAIAPWLVRFMRAGTRSYRRGLTGFASKADGLPRSRPTPATYRPVPRSSAPALIRSRSPRRSASACRSKPSAAIT